MNEQALAARRAYKRQWAKNNPEKVRAQQERYWTRMAQKSKFAKPSAEKNKKHESLNTGQSN